MFLYGHLVSSASPPSPAIRANFRLKYRLTAVPFAHRYEQLSSVDEFSSRVMWSGRYVIRNIELNKCGETGWNSGMSQRS